MLACVFVYIVVGTKDCKFTILVGTNSRYGDQNPGPHKSEGIFETQNVVLVSGLQLSYG